MTHQLHEAFAIASIVMTTAGCRLDVAEPASTMGDMAASEHGLTLAEHYAAGEDAGFRRELVDGVLIVSPYASRRHALAALRLSQILTAACPAELLVFGAPINVDLDLRRTFSPTCR